MIYVGIDDTDTLDTPGTNQLARALVARLRGRYDCVLIVRHQLLTDPRVPCTSKNGSASILLEPSGCLDRDHLIGELRAGMREWFVPGSDPGLCVTSRVPQPVTAFGQRCQSQFIRQAEARALAAEHEIFLEGLGGTEDGVIGALAAVGLAAAGDDGRVVHIGHWPDDLAGPQSLATLQARGVVVRTFAGDQVTQGVVDVGKHLRPNRRAGRIVLYVEPGVNHDADWQAVRLP